MQSVFYKCLIVVILISFAACVGQKRPESVRIPSVAEKEASPALRLIDTWVLNSLRGQVPTGLKDLPRLEFRTDFRFSGFSGCNAFNGTYKTDGKSILFHEQIIMTKKYCPIKLEGQFMGMIKNTDNFEIKGNELHMKRGEQILAVFRKVD